MYILQSLTSSPPPPPSLTPQQTTNTQPPKQKLITRCQSKFWAGAFFLSSPFFWNIPLRHRKWFLKMIFRHESTQCVHIRTEENYWSPNYYRLLPTIATFSDFPKIMFCYSFNLYKSSYKSQFCSFPKVDVLSLVLLNPDISCICKQCSSRSVGFWRSQLIWICTVCHSVCEFIASIWIK